MKTLILSATDIDKLIDMELSLNAVERSFIDHGKELSIMPPKIYLDLDKFGGDLRAMPAYISNQSGLKWVSVYPDNHKQKLPTVIGTLILNDPSTGFPLAIMDATLITNFRTGAGGGIGAKYLARAKSKSLGLVGTGVQAAAQLEAIAAQFDLEKILIWSVSEESMSLFLADTKGLPVSKASLEEVCGCDIIASTTPSEEPVIMNEWIKAGTHINAIGADAKGKQELDPQILKRAKVVVDEMTQAIHSGEVNKPISTGSFDVEDIYGTLGKIVASLKPGRVDESEVTVFDSTGLAIQDIVVAKELYLRAKKKGVGKIVNLIGT